MSWLGRNWWLLVLAYVGFLYYEMKQGVKTVKDAAAGPLAGANQAISSASTALSDIYSNFEDD